MKRKKTLLVVLLLLAAVLSPIGYFSYTYYRDRDVVEVRAGRASHMDLTETVKANGEIKPKKYVNISSNAFGRIQKLPVREGDHVRKGDLLLQLEAIQTQSEVSGAEAGIAVVEEEIKGMEAQARSAKAATDSARAEVDRTEAELGRAQLDYDRGQQLNRDGLISREQYDRAKNDVEARKASVAAAQARLQQTVAQADQIARQKDGLAKRLAQQGAALVGARDRLDKTTIVSPLDGIITRLPVNEGEIAIVGVQNQPGTTLMTIADMSVITAEAQVDETDIVRVKLGQKATVKVDALGDQLLTGTVSEIGNSAVAKAGAVPTGQEAREFKVVITLDRPPAELRPGLSATADIVIASRQQALAIPIQALTVRETDEKGAIATTANKDATSGGGGEKKTESEGVFIIDKGKAFFRAVKTGIAGKSDMEVLEGLSEGETIVTGSYQALRTLTDSARVKIEE